MSTNKDYNGWKNRSTWNCALWIGNDYGLYTAACDFMCQYKGKRPYKAFINYMGMEHDKTGDGIKWLSNRLCYVELNEFMHELVEG